MRLSHAVQRHAERQTNPMVAAVARYARILFLDAGPADHVRGNHQLLEPGHVLVYQFDDLGKVVPERRLAARQNHILDARVDGIGEDLLKVLQAQGLR